MSLKVLLILATVVTTAFCGVGVVTPEVEEKARRLWQQFCDGDSDGGQDGELFVYCKRARGAIKQSFQHTAEIGSAGAPNDQIVFVQPPAYHYKHDVIVNGGSVAARKTIIYVKPAKNTHEVNVKDETSPGGAAQKPTVFFLKGNHGGDSETDSGGQAPTSPPATYLPPAAETERPTQPPATYLPPTQPPATYLPPSDPTQEGYKYDAPENPLRYDQ